MAITKFIYSWEDELSSSETIGCKNRFQDSVSLVLQSGNIIPSDAIINSAYFTVTLDYGVNVESTMRVHYWPSSVTNVGWVSVSNGETNTYNNLPIISDTWYVKGISSNSETNTNINYKSSKYSYFRMTNSIPVCLSRTIYRTSTNPYAFYIRQSSQIILTVDWDDGAIYKNPNPPSNLTITPSTVILGENTTATLSWTAASMPADATNTITNYLIYQKNLSTGIWANIGHTTTGTPTTYDITIPQTIGTYYYTLTTITTEEGYDYTYTQMESLGSNYYAILTVQEEQIIGDVSGPTTVWHSLASNYIGTEGLPSSFTVGWSGASSGENNPIARYLISTPNEDYYINSTTTSGSKTIETSPIAGRYFIGVKGANTPSSSNYTGQSFTLLNIITPSSPTVYSISTPISDTTFTVQWQSISSNYSGVSSVSYNLYYCYNGGSWSSTPLVSNITGTSYVLDSSIFAPGQTFYIGVQAQFNATGAGYTRSDISSSNALIYSTSFAIPDPFWKAHYDAANGRTEATENHIYNSVTFVWNKISDTINSSYNYNLQQKKGNGAYESIATFNNVVPSTGTGSYTLNNLGGETQLSYQMVITDQYGSNTWSSPEIVINVIKPIEITNLRVDAVDADNITFYFDGRSYLPDTTNYDELLGDFYLSYGGAETALARNVSLNFSITNIQRTYPVSLVGKTSGTNFWGLLYNEVIKNRNPWPTIKLIIRARYEAFSQSVVSSSIDYKANYTTKPNYNNCIITLNRSTYYNPGDTAVATLSGFNWKDAAGGETGADIRNYLSSSISSNQFNFGASTFKTNIPIPSSSEDKNVTLTLNTQLTYATGTQTFTSAITANLTIARWIAEAVTISGVQLIDNTLEGYLVMPERYCGSDTLGNFKEVKPVLSSKTGGGTAVFYGYTSASDTTLKEQSSFNLTTLIKNDANEPRLIKFIYSGINDFSDIKLYFTATFTNTTNGTLVIEAVPYRYFTADIDFAIRKGRAGLNVGKDFGVDETNGSTLQINAWSNTKTDEEAIIEVFTSQESTDNTKTIFFALGSAANPDYIYKEGNNIFISNLYHPPANSLTNGTLTLDFSNTGLVLSGDKGGTILTEKNYSDYITIKQNVVSASADGLAPKISSSGTLNNSTNDQVLATKNGTLGWYKLPVTAFSDTTYEVATANANGLMSSTDKAKLDDIAEKANNYSLPTATSSQLGGVKIGHGVTVSSGTISVPKTFYQTSEPTSGMISGDLWFKPKTSN